MGGVETTITYGRSTCECQSPNLFYTVNYAYNMESFSQVKSLDWVAVESWPQTWRSPTFFENENFWGKPAPKFFRGLLWINRGIYNPQVFRFLKNDGVGHTLKAFFRSFLWLVCSRRYIPFRYFLTNIFTLSLLLNSFLHQSPLSVFFHSVKDVRKQTFQMAVPTNQ